MRGGVGAACVLMAIAPRADGKPLGRTAGRSAPASHAASTRGDPHSSPQHVNADARARSGARPEAHPAPPPAPPPTLAMLPSIARVAVEVAQDHVVVIEDVRFPRGEWRAGGIELYAAFGAPGAPAAVDAKWLSSADAVDPGRAASVGDSLAVERAFHRSGGAQILLGRPQMAGFVVRVREAEVRKAFEAGDAGVLRIRTLLPAPAADTRGARDVVVRLGAAADLPLTLGHVEVRPLGPTAVSRAEASLCGPEADPWPLAVAVAPSPSPRSGGSTAAGAPGAIDPAMAVRHVSDDLCVRWWADPR